MKSTAFLFAAALLVAGGISAGVHAAPSDQAAAEKVDQDSTKKICRSMGETGSRLKVTKVCMTKAEWDEQRRQQRMAVEHGQTAACVRGAGC